MWVIEGEEAILSKLKYTEREFFFTRFQLCRKPPKFQFYNPRQYTFIGLGKNENPMN